LIKEVQKLIKSRKAEEREKKDLVKQDTLVLSQNVSLAHWRRTRTVFATHGSEVASGSQCVAIKLIYSRITSKVDFVFVAFSFETCVW
jgi:hypothetical protein